MAKKIFAKKNLDVMMAETADSEKGLHRTLTAGNLIALGIGAIIGAGLFVDNEIGAATATGHGEEIIRIAGCHLVVELMRQGRTPEEACREAVERVFKKQQKRASEIQVGFIALNRAGQYGSYCLQKGFSYAVHNNSGNRLIEADSRIK